MVWVGTALIKVCRLRIWSVCCLAIAAALLPFGGGIGTPIYALFAIIVAVYATALGWSHVERMLSLVKIRFLIGSLAVLILIILMIRSGMVVPIVTNAAQPLLAERERTYQLERILAWQHDSKYCNYDISFAEAAGSPVYSSETAIKRTNRPPSALEDVRTLWNGVLRCAKAGALNGRTGTVIVTFGESPWADLRPVYRVGGRYAGDAFAWVADSE
jgi:hypothetical protein